MSAEIFYAKFYGSDEYVRCIKNEDNDTYFYETPTGYSVWSEKAREVITMKEYRQTMFIKLIEKSIIEAEKAMVKFPQPNYVLLKVAEEAGEVVKEGVHCSENRGDYGNLEVEMKQTIAMLYRLYVEGDETIGLKPLLSVNKCQ